MGDSEIVQVVSEAQRLRWQPVEGSETLALLDHLKLDGPGRDRVIAEAAETLGRSAPPDSSAARETGLVVGYVQSGKTMSFTTVAALARDNGYRLIIVCTGVTVNLYEQSRDRLRRDLRFDDRKDRHWLFLPNPHATHQVRQALAAALDDSHHLPGLPKQTVLITVMKNATWLDNLTRMLRELDLRTVPTLVIDDEGDQASLNNNVRSGTESATYRRVLGIRGLLPHHTFLEYTATPQAMLLINMIDVLSPEFAVVLTPGQAYTGGRAFFEGDLELVRAIPDNDIPGAHGGLTEPPDSLLEALRIFFLGVAVGLRDGGAGNRSMMVHPSHRIIPHGDYYNWITHTQALWDRILGAAADDPDLLDLLEDFDRAHADLASTVEGLPGMDDLLPYLRHAIRTTPVTEINTRAAAKTAQPDWHQIYSHIVVGGEVLNRGYTVEGLSVTYMPRGLGTGQADTIQQRARWFGYKADYLGYCRVFLARPALDAYRRYVDHEERLRRQLQRHLQSGRSLKEWRRAFFLDPALRPTRDSVIGTEFVRGNFVEKDWYYPVAPQEGDEAVESNRHVVTQFIAELSNRWAETAGHPKRTNAQKHLVAADISLALVYERLLVQARHGRLKDSARYNGLLLQIGDYLEKQPKAVCSVFHMDPHHVREERGVDDEGDLLNLFQGANYDNSVSPPAETYPGDRAYYAQDELSVQLHWLSKVTHRRSVVARDVPVIAVRVPSSMSGFWISQLSST